VKGDFQIVPGALEGITVLDCGVVQLGPTAGSLLGDLGAKVIKIEPPITGEMGRGIEILTSATSRINAGGSHFEIWNRNKRGMTLDLTKPAGLKIFYNLVKSADVFLCNWRYGVTEKLKIDYDTLVQYNHKIVYAYASPWGTKGPDKDEQGMDFAAMARSGMAFQAGEPDDPPINYVSGFADTTAGLILVQGILAALFARERTGISQKVEVSLLGSMVAGLERLPVNSSVQSGAEMPRKDRTKVGNPLWNYYKCREGAWIALSMLAADNYWPSFCTALDIKYLENDPRFKDITTRSQLDNSKELIRILDQIFENKTSNEWIKILKTHKLICTCVQTISDLLSDPQVLANEYIIDYTHPIFGQIKTVGFPWHFNKTPATLRLPAPQLGQHTEEILLEYGYSWNDISDFKTQHIV
jgi:crotonobetainyl-CoA:carnitine CoA-transferase CaiB-like acyl-CoA transferase